MTEVSGLLVRFMEYLGMSPDNKVIQPGREYRFKNVAFRNDRREAFRRGLDHFWRRTGFELQSEDEYENTLTFSMLSRAGTSGFQIRIIFDDKVSEQILIFNFLEADRTPLDFDRQFLKENGLSMS